MSHRIASVQAAPAGQLLTIRWTSGAVTTKDLRREIVGQSAYAPLRDQRRFQRVRVLDHGYAIGWAGTAIAFAADALWYQAHPREMPFPDQIMTADDFKAWQREQGLSLSSAAQMLGLSRRTIGYYGSGDRPIPRVVFLACMAIAGSRRRSRKAA